MWGVGCRVWDWEKGVEVRRFGRDVGCREYVWSVAHTSSSVRADRHFTPALSSARLRFRVFALEFRV